MNDRLLIDCLETNAEELEKLFVDLAMSEPSSAHFFLNVAQYHQHSKKLYEELAKKNLLRADQNNEGQIETTVNALKKIISANGVAILNWKKSK